METLPQSAQGGVGPRGDLKILQVRLPKGLAQRAKASAAEKGQTLQQLVRDALEQYLGMGKAA